MALFLIILSVLCFGLFGVFLGMTIMQKNVLSCIVNGIGMGLILFTISCEVNILIENTLAVTYQATEQGAIIELPQLIQKDYERRYRK